MVKQHRKPCKTCPFTRNVTPGELGGSPPEVYVGQLFLPYHVPCHEAIDYDDEEWKIRTNDKPQCVGFAMCRDAQGVAKKMPDALLHVTHDPETGAFSNIFEFWAHHKQISVAEAREQLHNIAIMEMCRDELKRAGARFIDPATIPQGTA